MYYRNCEPSIIPTLIKNNTGFILYEHYTSNNLPYEAQIKFLSHNETEKSHGTKYVSDLHMMVQTTLFCRLFAILLLF